MSHTEETCHQIYQTILSAIRPQPPRLRGQLYGYVTHTLARLAMGLADVIARPQTEAGTPPDLTPGSTPMPDDTSPLDQRVRCAFCRRDHAHMRECPYARPWRCPACGARRWTADAIVEHGRHHVAIPPSKEHPHA